MPYIDRSVYPEAEYRVGQWDFQFLYEESFDAATRAPSTSVRVAR